MAQTNNEELRDIIMGMTRAIITSTVEDMEALSHTIGAEGAVIVGVNACLGAAVGVYKTWADATDSPFDKEYLRRSLESALQAKFLVAERNADGSFADPTPFQ